MLGLIFVSLSLWAGVTGGKFKDAQSGFGISAPKNWEFLKEPKTYGIELKNSGMTSSQSGIVISLAKKVPPGFAGVRPTVGVTKIKSNPKGNLVKWLEQELESQKHHDQYYFPASTPIGTTLGDDTGAARAAFINSTVINGQQVRVYHAVYAVKSGGSAFLINMNCNEDMSNEMVNDFSEIAGSIEADPRR